MDMEVISRCWLEDTLALSRKRGGDLNDASYVFLENHPRNPKGLWERAVTSGAHEDASGHTIITRAQTREQCSPSYTRESKPAASFVLRISSELDPEVLGSSAGYSEYKSDPASRKLLRLSGLCCCWALCFCRSASHASCSLRCLMDCGGDARGFQAPSVRNAAQAGDPNALRAF